MWHGVDMAGNPRIVYGGLSRAVDMEAYEYVSCPVGIVKAVKLAGGEVSMTWSSRPDDTYSVWSCLDVVNGSWKRKYP